MSKKPALVASVITMGVSFILAIFFGLGGIVLLNGYMNADAAIYTGFLCLIGSVILCVVLAWRFTTLFISKLQVSPTLAAILAIVISSFLSGLLGFFSTLLMALVAETTH